MNVVKAGGIYCCQKILKECWRTWLQLSVTEAKFSRSQIVTLNENQQGHNIKYLPFAFTEQRKIKSPSEE